MTQKIVDRTAIQQAIDAAGVEADITGSYSGRGMYGEVCFGLIARSGRDITRILVALASQDPDLANDLSFDVRTDDMGLREIAYWPGYTIDEDDSDRSEALLVWDDKDGLILTWGGGYDEGDEACLGDPPDRETDALKQAADFLATIGLEPDDSPLTVKGRKRWPYAINDQPVNFDIGRFEGFSFPLRRKATN